MYFWSWWIIFDRTLWQHESWGVLPDVKCCRNILLLHSSPMRGVYCLMCIFKQVHLTMQHMPQFCILCPHTFVQCTFTPQQISLLLNVVAMVWGNEMMFWRPVRQQKPEKAFFAPAQALCLVFGRVYDSYVSSIISDSQGLSRAMFWLVFEEEELSVLAEKSGANGQHWSISWFIQNRKFNIMSLCFMSADAQLDIRVRHHL